MFLVFYAIVSYYAFWLYPRMYYEQKPLMRHVNLCRHSEVGIALEQLYLEFLIVCNSCSHCLIPPFKFAGFGWLQEIHYYLWNLCHLVLEMMGGSIMELVVVAIVYRTTIIIPLPNVHFFNCFFFWGGCQYKYITRVIVNVNFRFEGKLTLHCCQELLF